ncbi:hypothetical protein cypCar_00020123 [Cyprinus carpio]|nr:hypothetical protein cypCar_00020123 [Cyprinus carpio]
MMGGVCLFCSSVLFISVFCSSVESFPRPLTDCDDYGDYVQIFSKFGYANISKLNFDYNDAMRLGCVKLSVWCGVEESGSGADPECLQEGKLSQTHGTHQCVEVLTALTSLLLLSFSFTTLKHTTQWAQWRERYEEHLSLLYVMYYSFTADVCLTCECLIPVSLGSSAHASLAEALSAQEEAAGVCE